MNGQHQPDLEADSSRTMQTENQLSVLESRQTEPPGNLELGNQPSESGYQLEMGEPTQ